MFKLEFKTDTVAFSGYHPIDLLVAASKGVKAEAVARSLEKVVCQLRDGTIEGGIPDSNGGTLGFWSLTDD
jgi:hypothetical protein